MSEQSRIGMPTHLYLQDFGQLVLEAFGEVAYHVGSSLEGPGWRDVDVRVILSDEHYAAMELGDPTAPHCNAKWCALTKVFSAYGKAMTGLPIDFQIQQQTYANTAKCNRGHRGALFRVYEKPKDAGP